MPHVNFGLSNHGLTMIMTLVMLLSVMGQGHVASPCALKSQSMQSDSRGFSQHEKGNHQFFLGTIRVPHVTCFDVAYLD